MSLQSMITGANLPLGSIGTLFKNPAGAAMSAFGVSTGGVGLLSSAVAAISPGFDPSIVTGGMSSSISSITDGLSSKLKSMGTELQIALAAQAQQTTISNVDNILNKTLDLSGSQQIGAAFSPVTSPCGSSIVNDSFKSLTESPNVVNSGNTAVATNFDNTGAMSTLYTALNAIPGVSVNNGTELLALLGNSPSLAVQAAVAAATATSPALVLALKSAFDGVYKPGATPTDPPTGASAAMVGAFNVTVAESSAAVQQATDLFTGGNTVSLINSSNPCVKTLMGSVIDPVKVDQNALSLSTGLKTNTVSLPGQESVAATNMTKPLELGAAVNNPVTPAAQMVTPVAGPTIQPYTSDQLSGFRNQLIAQNDTLNSINTANATWYKTNVEDWKQQTQYEAKKTAAGATTAHPYGTSTDPAVLAAWRAVYGEPNSTDPNTYIYKKNIFNASPYQPDSVAARLKFDQMKSEYDQRAKYGQFPYTYQIAQGISVPPDKQYTYLAPTK